MVTYPEVLLSRVTLLFLGTVAFATFLSGLTVINSLDISSTEYDLQTSSRLILSILPFFYLKKKMILKVTPGTTGTISTYMGPGFWYIIHKLAYLVRVTLEEDSCIAKIKKLIDIFPCDDCSSHGKNYYMMNPIEMYKGVRDSDGNLIGIYLWTFYFHNAVNERIGKDLMRYEDSLELYSGNESCDQLCDISKFL